MADRTGLLHDVPAPRPEPAAERAPLAWWHLRGWRVDRHVLARVRDGLHALAPRPETAAAPLSEVTQPVAQPADQVAGQQAGQNGAAPEAPAARAAAAASPATKASPAAEASGTPY